MKEELIGLTVVEEDVIKCGDCGAPLAHVVVSETNEQRTSRNLPPISSKYKITDCYKCNGSSFYTKVFGGSTSICPTKDFFDLDETDTEFENGVISSTLKVRKRTNG